MSSLEQDKIILQYDCSILFKKIDGLENWFYLNTDYLDFMLEDLKEKSVEKKLVQL